MASRAQSVIASGRGVILDGTFASPEQRKVAEDLARNNRRPFLFVELTGNEDLLRSRLRRRSSQLSESDAREEHLPTMLRSFCPAEELRCAERFVVDGGLAVSDLTARIKARLPGGVARGSQL